MDNNAKIKVDFNLLQSGTWVLEKKGNQKIHYFEKKLGSGKIIIYNALDVPSPIDSKILDCLMFKSQEQHWSEVISIESLRALAKELGIGTDKKRLDRIRKGLEILVNTRICFENCFVDSGTLDYIKGGNYETINIGILTDYAIEKVKSRGKPRKITIWFNRNFLAICRYSLGYKLIPYAPIQGLRDTAYALYKWAYRWYDSERGYGERWIGNGQSLVKWYKNELNSIAQYKYPSEVLRPLRSAVEQLNKNKEVPFCIRINEENGNYKIELCRKEKIPIKRKSPFDALPLPIKRAIVKLIETKKKDIKSPYAYACSITWKELEVYLNNLLVLDIAEEWEFVKQVLEWGNEFKTFESETLAMERRNEGKSVVIVFERSSLNKGYLATFFKAFPNLKTFIYPAKDWVKGEEILHAVSNNGETFCYSRHSDSHS